MINKLRIFVRFGLVSCFFGCLCSSIKVGASIREVRRAFRPRPSIHLQRSTEFGQFGLSLHTFVYICNVNSLWRGASNTLTETDRQTDRQAGRQGGRQAGRHTSKEIPTCTYLISINYVGVFRCYMHYLRIIKALSFQLTV